MAQQLIVTHELDTRPPIDVIARRYGCSADTSEEQRACGLYLWLLGPTTTQLATSCPCRLEN